MIKKLVMFGIIAIFLLSGCEQLKELYGIQPSGQEDYIPLEDIKIEGEAIAATELPPTPPGEEIPEDIVEIIKEEPKGDIVDVIKEEPEEIVEQKPKQEAKVLITKETELVSLKPKASDPDKDKLIFSYTTPIDTQGKWQTTYGDAGEYAVTITASDGQLSTTKDILIIVNKKEESPVIGDSLPKESALEAKENSKIEFSVKASDLNKDPLKYSWKLDNTEVSKTQGYTYSMSYDSAGQHAIQVVVSDGAKDVSRTWSVKVENVNRKPVLEKIANIKVKETDSVIIQPKASDPDKEDKITFSIDSDNFKKTEDKFEWKTTYDDSGEYTVKITASDGKDAVTQTVMVTVENVNRPPVIEDIILG